jgi:DNA-binding NarL/FixJ family response regulator
MISLEEFQENYTTSHNGQQWDEPDFSQNVEENVTAQILVEQFKATLSERDLDVLQMRMKGCTLKTIAEKLGYRNHSGVAKRIRKIGLNYEKITGEKYGFEDNIITS